METKEEVIKEAWFQTGIEFEYNSDGWSIRHDINDSEVDLKHFDLISFISGYRIRPKSLKGIENNNGWIKIESEKDLPKNGNYWVIYNDDTISDCVKENELFEDDEYWLKNITHYQQINKPQPPLYKNEKTKIYYCTTKRTL